jgi:hypothetical protein
LAEILNREEVPKIINSKLISMAMAVGISLLENSRQSYSADSNQTVNKTTPLFFKKKIIISKRVIKIISKYSRWLNHPMKSSDKIII